MSAISSADLATSEPSSHSPIELPAASPSSTDPKLLPSEAADPVPVAAPAVLQGGKEVLEEIFRKNAGASVKWSDSEAQELLSLVLEVGIISCNMQLFKLSKPVRFKCVVLGEVTSEHIAIELDTQDLLSQSAYQQRLIELQKQTHMPPVHTPPVHTPPFHIPPVHYPPPVPPGGPDKHIYRPASKSGAMKCAGCDCYSRELANTGRCPCGKKRKFN